MCICYFYFVLKRKEKKRKDEGALAVVGLKIFFVLVNYHKLFCSKLNFLISGVHFQLLQIAAIILNYGVDKFVQILLE